MRTSPKYRVVLLTVGASISLVTVTPAATFSANPSFDAFVTTGPTANLSANNYGAAGSLGVAAVGKAQGEFQTVLQFDLSGARSAFNTQFGAGQWSVQSVTLQLNSAAANNAIFNTPSGGQFGVSWMQNDSWNEGTGSPNTPSASGINFTSLQGTFIGAGDEALGTFAYNGATSGANSYTLALTPGFIGDATAGNAVSLRLSAADGLVSYLFNSREFGTTANRPLLSVTAVPEPDVLALGALGLIVLAGWKYLAPRTRA